MSLSVPMTFAVYLSGVAIERDLNLGGLVDDVIVGEDETFFIDDYS